MNGIDTAILRAVAETALPKNVRRFRWNRVIANVGSGRIETFIRTFDPKMVLRLLDTIEDQQAILNDNQRTFQNAVNHCKELRERLEAIRVIADHEGPK